MIANEWSTKRLAFSKFGKGETAIVKRLFEANSHLRDLDPVFTEYPDDEYSSLILRDGSAVPEVHSGTFYLRKISDHKRNALGYIQLELDTPKKGKAWIPMLVFHPDHQNLGYGKEAIDSILEIIVKLNSYSEVELNVYARNLKAFEFWFKRGFGEIVYWSNDTHYDMEYQCLVLRKRLK